MEYCLFDYLADDESKLHQYDVCHSHVECSDCQYFVSDEDEFNSVIECFERDGFLGMKE